MKLIAVPFLIVAAVACFTTDALLTWAATRRDDFLARRRMWAQVRAALAERDTASTP